MFVYSILHFIRNQRSSYDAPRKVTPRDRHMTLYVDPLIGRIPCAMPIPGHRDATIRRIDKRMGLVHFRTNCYNYSRIRNLQ